ncbi:hypothetical protein OAL21_02940 [Akkermansiaceae bacterium]|nr:hypothetical protein [Akkermansiaceae bacterium]
MKNIIRKTLSNIPGWRTNRKLVVFESDDWGSIRTRDLDALNYLKGKNFDTERSNFVRYDSLERSEDLSCLFEVLTSVKDGKGRKAVLTPMTIMGNPDFRAIRDNQYEEFVVEPFTETLKSFPGSKQVLSQYKQGMESKIWHPEYHGREHLNHLRWLRGLRAGEKGLITPFEVESFGFKMVNGKKIREHLAAYDPEFESDIPLLEQSLIEGIDMFRSILGVDPHYFVASKSPEPKVFERSLALGGIKYLTRYKLQQYPLGNGKFHREFNWLGKRNRFGQLAITRNASFEPSDNPNHDWIDSCLNEVKLAFQLKKPAVISSHRVNYVGRLSKSNQSNGLQKLEELLKKIVDQWPEVEFVSSRELGEIIVGK